MRVLALLLALAGGAAAQEVDPAAFPPEVRAGWEAFRDKTGHRAFAWNGADAWGYSYEAQGWDSAAELAVGACDQRRGALRFFGAGGPTCQPVTILGPEDVTP